MTTKKPHIDRKAATWTTISLIILGILMFLFGFKTTPQVEESGMLINFGDTETGSGQVEPPKATPPAKTPPPPPPKPQTEVSAADQEAINTQNFEEAAAIEAAKKKAEERKIRDAEIRELKRQQEIEIERQKAVEQEKIVEAERLRQEELERQEQERLEREAKAEAIRQQTSNAFGKTNNIAQSQGTGEGSGNQGSPNGSTTSNGQGLGTSGNWSLAGRSLQGSLPKPNYKLQKEGVVVVEIAVDRNGKVLSATPILRGSTTQDAQLWKLAKEAALKARFNANPTAQAKQVGTITYKFVLN